jgi:hypothetical protein
VKFRIGALTQDRAGIEDLVARLEQGDIGPDRIDDPGGVVAEDFGFSLGRGGTLADLVVDRVEIAFTATLMSRPLGSCFAVSKSISASAASIGSDFLYPTAFIWRFSLCPAEQRRPAANTCGLAGGIARTPGAGGSARFGRRIGR